MMKRLLIAGAVLTALAVAACGGHGAGVTPRVLSSPQMQTGPQATFDWGSAQLQGATLMGPATLAHMQVDVLVNQQNAQGLIAYAREVSDPSSALYRHFLTPQEIGARFGATQSDYQNTANYFVQHGLVVGGWPQHLGMVVAGSQSAMERAFGTTFGLFEKDGRSFVAPLSTPRFSASIPVSAAQGLVNVHTMQRYFMLPARGTINPAGYAPQQVQNAFDYSGAYRTGYDGTGITIGIIATGPIDVASNGTTTWCGDQDVQTLVNTYTVPRVASVCQEYVTTSGVAAGLSVAGIPTAAPAPPNPTVSPSPNPGVSPTSMFPFSGDFASPPPVTGACSGSLPACNPEDLEAQLDTQQAATLAPGSSVVSYLAYNASDCYVFYPNTCASPAPSPLPSGSNYGQPQIGIVEMDPELEQAIADDKADVISISVGGGEPQQIGGDFNASGVGFEPVEFAALASEGVAVFVASGDSGAAECTQAFGFLAEPCVAYPGGDPNVTSVGGVNAPINEFGQLTNPMTAWGVGTMNPSSPGGSGGGVSTIFSAPTWQQSAISATMRTQPDVSLIGDPFTGVSVASSANSCGVCVVGGTSVATPEMAAMWALVLDACKNTPACSPGGVYRLGNAAPYLYSIYKNAALVPGSSFSPKLPYANVFYDVVYGSNAMPTPVPTAGPVIGPTAGPVTGYAAGPGYDESTGLGVPFAGHLIEAITGQVVQ